MLDASVLFRFRIANCDRHRSCLMPISILWLLADWLRMSTLVRYSRTHYYFVVTLQMVSIWATEYWILDSDLGFSVLDIGGVWRENSGFSILFNASLFELLANHRTNVLRRACDGYNDCANADRKRKGKYKRIVKGILNRIELA